MYFVVFDTLCVSSSFRSSLVHEAHEWIDWNGRGTEKKINTKYVFSVFLLLPKAMRYREKEKYNDRGLSFSVWWVKCEMFFLKIEIFFCLPFFCLLTIFFLLFNQNDDKNENQSNELNKMRIYLFRSNNNQLYYLVIGENQLVLISFFFSIFFFQHFSYVCGWQAHCKSIVREFLCVKSLLVSGRIENRNFFF